VGNFEHALEFLDEMESLGIEPKHLTYQNLLIACDSSGNFPLAIRLGSKLQMHQAHMAQSSLPSSKKVSHTVARTSRNRADTLVSRASQMQPGVEAQKTFEEAIVAYGQGGHWEQAVATLNQMEKGGFSALEQHFNAAIAVCGETGQLQPALDLLEKMEQFGIKPNDSTYQVVLDACKQTRDTPDADVAKRKELEESLKILQEASKLGLL
jgi:pentatricopeptide repeat protein